MVKLCRDCKLEKSPQDYYPSQTTYCKACTNIRNRRSLDQKRGFSSSNHLNGLRKYWPDLNLVALQRKYTTLFEDQNGVCAVCLTSETGGRRLAVDHCHSTGKVRGLLCVRCNTGIVKALDNQMHLVDAATTYLQQA